jgi:hypothetical protein
MTEKLFVLYDGRAKLSDPDNASIYTTVYTERDAKYDGQEPSWQDGIWYEYDIIDGCLENGRARWDLPPATNN